MSFGFALSIGRPATAAAAECAVSRKIGLFVLNDGDVFFVTRRRTRRFSQDGMANISDRV